MKATRFLPTAAATLLLLAGCIVSDELTTITIQPDGSADWIRFQSNVRSTEKGEKRTQELKKFVDEFDAQTDSECVRITDAGGEVLDARWVRRAEPYATLVTAKFPSAAALETFCTIKGEKGAILAQARFTLRDNRRRLSLRIPMPGDEQSADKTPPTFTKLREQQANAISETRVVVAGGRIVASQGFVVADDKRSCLLDSAEIDALLRSDKDHIELFLEWELDQK